MRGSCKSFYFQYFPTGQISRFNIGQITCSQQTTIKKTIEDARKLLKENQWVDKYKKYAEILLSKEEGSEKRRKNFREWAPLYFYTCISLAAEAGNRLVLDVRYMGQNVARLTCGENGQATISTKGSDYNYDANNRGHFECKIPLDHEDWKGKEAAAFRKHFRDREQVRNDGKKGNAEHNIESLLLTEFSKRGEDKALRGIQPVRFAGIRFAMPTALSASKGLRLAEKKGGGVDILARVGSGRHTRLCVIEVKDEYDAKEPPQKVLQQAVAYAVFIRELLRSEAGPLWWRLFGFRGEMPAPLTLYAACAMPTQGSSGKPDDESFAGTRLDVGGDSIECHYIYFNKAGDNASLQSLKTSLPQMGR